MTVEKTSDVTVYGATGMTGKYISRYLMAAARTENKPLKITLAGRNKTKLEARKEMLLAADLEKNNEQAQLEIFVADSQDLTQLRRMVEQTRAVICCAGPFMKYANFVVQACAEKGTDYVDITGEVAWYASMRQKHGAAAKESGARIISLCGFDSVPSDIAIYAAVQALRQVRGNNVEIEQGTTWYSARSGINGGTLATLSSVPMDVTGMFMDESGKIRSVPFLVDDPLVASHPTEIRFHPDYQQRKNQLALSEWMNQLPNFERMLGWAVSIPFMMAVANSKVVQSSAVALNYGPNFTYKERHVVLGWTLTRMLGVLSIIPSLLVQLGGLLGMTALRLPVVGQLFLDWFAPPGSGMGDDFNDKCFAQVYAAVHSKAAAPSNSLGGSSVDRATCYMDFQGDAGNLVTAQCVCESALSLLWSNNKEDLPPKSTDGFGTPAELLGPVLLKRLQQNKVRRVDIYTKVVKDDSPAPTQLHLYG